MEEEGEVELMEMLGGTVVREASGGWRAEGRDEDVDRVCGEDGTAVMQVMGESAIVILAAMWGWLDGWRLSRVSFPASLSLLHTHRQLTPLGSTQSPSAPQDSYNTHPPAWQVYTKLSQ